MYTGFSKYRIWNTTVQRDRDELVSFCKSNQIEVKIGILLFLQTMKKKLTVNSVTKGSEEGSNVFPAPASTSKIFKKWRQLPDFQFMSLRLRKTSTEGDLWLRAGSLLSTFIYKRRANSFTSRSIIITLLSLMLEEVLVPLAPTPRFLIQAPLALALAAKISV